jgi:hypothetical protein
MLNNNLQSLKTDTISKSLNPVFIVRLCITFSTSHSFLACSAVRKRAREENVNCFILKIYRLVVNIDYDLFIFICTIKSHSCRHNKPSLLRMRNCQSKSTEKKYRKNARTEIYVYLYNKTRALRNNLEIEKKTSNQPDELIL